MATLTSVVLNLVGLNVTNKINCQVSTESSNYYTLPLLTNIERKLWITFTLVSILTSAPNKFKKTNNAIFPFPQIFGYLAFATASLLIVLRMYVIVLLLVSQFFVTIVSRMTLA